MDVKRPADFARSRPVDIIPFQRRWHHEFLELGNRLRNIVGQTAIRIDHIGSTSVLNLPAKDIIDIQITVADLHDTAQFLERMRLSGFRERGDLRSDELTGYPELPPEQLQKRYFREPQGDRRAHIHIRQQDNVNQQYALLFRDYLRANCPARESYALIKQRLAGLFPDQIEGYLYIKDPVMDLIYQSARLWASQTSWSPDQAFL